MQYLPFSIDNLQFYSQIKQDPNQSLTRYICKTCQTIKFIENCGNVVGYVNDIYCDNKDCKIIFKDKTNKAYGEFNKKKFDRID